MSSIDFEVDLSHEESEIQSTVHRFAAEVLRPAGQALDKLADPQDVVDKGSLLWDTFEKYDALGIGGLNLVDPEMSPAQQARLQTIILEEIAWGDAGFAISLACRGMMGMWAELSGQKDLIERVATPGNQEIGCWAITEPDHGSDTLAMSEPHFTDPDIKANCIARKDGDDYIIQGQKASWVSNGPIATGAALFCTIEGDKGFEGGGVAVVPLDLPGVSKGRPLDKIGQRALPQGEIFFDEVRIPGGYMAAGQETYKDVLNMQLTMANSFMGVSFAGVARSAFDLANEIACVKWWPFPKTSFQQPRHKETQFRNRQRREYCLLDRLISLHLGRESGRNGHQSRF